MPQIPKKSPTPETLHRAFCELRVKLTGCSRADTNATYSHHLLARIRAAIGSSDKIAIKSRKEPQKISKFHLTEISVQFGYFVQKAKLISAHGGSQVYILAFFSAA
jgi:hypothetical protein